MKKLLHRIFGDKEVPQGMDKAQFQVFMDEAITNFEEGGFLKETALPPVNNDFQLVDKLAEAGSDLVVIKFWKRRCLPCLSMAEMYKDAERHYASSATATPAASTEAGGGGAAAGGSAPLPGVRFLSVNSKDPDCKDIVTRQLVEGTPTIQLFHCGRQVGTSIEATTLEDFIRDVDGLRHHLPATCPTFA